MEMKLNSFDKIEKHSKELHELSKFLCENPETAFEEYKAHDYLTDYLENNGFNLERSFLYDTGFRATYMTGSGTHFVILVEYDALPKIGQGCGHNLIALSSVATAIGFKAAMDNGLECKLSVLGTPAEELGGGKIKFISEGIFNDVDLAIMSHPFNKNFIEMQSLALIGLTIFFYGKDAHASLIPWHGINALDAAVLAYQSIGCLRQQLNPSYRIHGIICNGGDAENIIPSFTEMRYCVRTPKLSQLRELLPRIYACFTGAAKMSGCEVQFKEHPIYENLVNNKLLMNTFKINAEALGIVFSKHETDAQASTDCGNVSHVCPTIHPLFSIGRNVDIHTKEFEIEAGKSEANVLAIKQAKAMCGTLIDVLIDENGDLLKNIKLEFQKFEE